MPKITQKQITEQIKMLKDIKPREEWASLLKSQILSQAPANAVKQAPGFAEKSVSILDVLSSIFYQRKTAYAFATLVVMIAGILGFAQYTFPGDALFPIKKISEQGQANLLGVTALNKDIAKLNNRVNDLAQIAKEGRNNNMPSVMVEIKENASELAKNLEQNEVQDPLAVKEIAATLKTLAGVAGAEINENESVKGLYKAVVENQIADFEKATLTKEQKEEFEKAKLLYEEGKYSQALEGLLIIGN